MSMPKQNVCEWRLSHGNRCSPQAQAQAEARHLLYLRVRAHLKAGWDQLPEGLTERNFRDLAIMAKARSDHRMFALCSRARGDVPTPASIAANVPDAGQTENRLP